MIHISRIMCAIYCTHTILLKKETDLLTCIVSIDYIEKDAQSISSSTGETNDSAASSPLGPSLLSEPVETVISPTRSKPPPQSFQRELVPAAQNSLDSSAVATATAHVSPTKRQHSQSGTIFKADGQESKWNGASYNLAQHNHVMVANIEWLTSHNLLICEFFLKWVHW